MSEKYYIDADQFTTATHYEVINIEKPAFQSKQYYALLTLPIEITKDAISTSYPVHFRYQKASTTEFAKVVLSPLRSLRIQCPSALYSFKEMKTFSSPSAKVPIGQIEDKTLVFIVTLVVTLYCAMTIKKSMKGGE